MPTTDTPWYGPYSPWISDEEKSEAINRMTRDLKDWRARVDAEDAEKRRVGSESPNPTL